MKVGILTLPLGSNYGGILQALALQTTLGSLGHEVVILDKESELYSSRFILYILHDLKYYIRILLHRPNYTLTNRQLNRVTKKLTNFISCNIKKSKKLHSDKMLIDYIKHERFDAIVVGSDQVWRPYYTKNIYNYYLDIDNNNIKKISYASSFGVDNWEYNENQTIKCRELLKQFSAISVREISGRKFCSDYFGITSEVVLDPTLLHHKDYYLRLIKDYSLSNDSSLFCYILDDSLSKQNIINTFAKRLTNTILIKFPIIPLTPDALKHRPKNFSLPSIEKWIESFYKADYVITDSFHGMVFSIIFNKTFWVIGNNERGNSRFTSLLNQLGLTDRIITDQTSLNTIDVNKIINWDKINSTLEVLREKSLKFLIKNL